MARATHAARDDDDDAGTRRGDATRRARVARATRVAAVVIAIEVAAGHRARTILAAFAPRDVDDASPEVDARARIASPSSSSRATSTWRRSRRSRVRIDG